MHMHAYSTKELRLKTLQSLFSRLYGREIFFNTTRRRLRFVKQNYFMQLFE